MRTIVVKEGKKKCVNGSAERGSCERIMKRDDDPTLLARYYNDAWKIDVAYLLN